ncbi:uncharacterized protein LOC118748708 isoform X2 [Rhagoletis pomonella]|uniref:uncharacterized protein LOC118748708 isoform X2 n=1 Tax=Rhagoletis pomonella TaxID=28610 RepID=UPI001781CED1|nr:uncharacterized protein LOC118748708 isoform X2 [Rhagoletis pomonella]
MSWVQQNASPLPPTLLPHQQSLQQPPNQQISYSEQQQKHQIQQQQQPPQSQPNRHLSTQAPLAQPNFAGTNITNAYTNPVPPLASNLPPSTGAYLSKPINANNNTTQPQQQNHQQNSMRAQMHANGGTHQQQQPGHIDLQQQQPTPASAAWQQPSYVQPNKMLPANAATANSNWPHPPQQQPLQQQQQQQQQPLQQQQQQQQPHTNNLYAAQQPHTNVTHNIWQPPDLPPADVANNVPQQQQPQNIHQTTYDNYFTSNQMTQQQPPQPPLSTVRQPTYPQPPQQPQQQQVAHDAANFFQSQPQYQQQQPAQSAADIFDNNNATKSEGWGDWDWNDNGNVIGGDAEQVPAGQQQKQPMQLPIHKPVQHPPQQQHSFEQQSTNYTTTSVIEDSFGTQSSNDNWNWNLSDDVNANANTVGVEKQSTTLQPPQVPTNTTTNNRQASQVPRQVASSIQVPQQQAAEFAGTDASGVKAVAANILVKPTSLPLTEATNENYNTSALPMAPNLIASAPSSTVSSVSVTTNSNIPNSVYVSQAKPVSRPSRQYASPPGVASPTTEPLENALAPPQAFQNEISATQLESNLPSVAPVTNSAPNLPLQNLPPPAMTPPSSLPPPPGAGAAAASNPFKRAGAAQHHRAGLLATSSAAQPPVVPQLSSAVATAFAVPPPPADFANPLLNHLEPDNSEILHENQEVLGAAVSSPPTAITLLGTTAAATVTQASLPPPPPPNDERNQYLQTSPLSENPDEELNLEADSLPPPGLSRLVLGQPELLEASQRMVTGTEEPANMHMDERHADGEDTSLEQAQPTTLLNASQRVNIGNGGNLGAPAAASVNNSNTIDITTDRNLYLVPGESNVNNEQRVVTGVERSPEGNAPAPPSQIASGQREIELDGENLEDQQQEQQQLLLQQQQQHQHQHQQHQHQHQQHQLPPPLLTVNSRDEPPLEGAAATAEPLAPSATDDHDVHQHHAQHHHHHQSSKSKDLSNASTGNDESDPVAEHHHHATRYLGNNKSRKHSIGELDRKVLDRHQQQRRDKHRSSVDRYESDDLELDESEPYSSDRERERERERERRRGYREGSVRSDREREEREYAKDKRRRAGERGEKRDERGAGEREKLREKYYGRESGKSDTVRRSVRHSRQYEEDADDVSSRRKELARRSGARHHNEERAGRSDRSERDYDDYNRRQRGSNKRVGEKGIDDGRDARRSNYVDEERREQRRARRERGGDNDTIERRHRAGGGEKPTRAERGERGDAREYEEYRKQSSRNARESDLEKERGVRYDPRHAAMYGYPQGAFGYDPYTSYYYEQMARTNPQAYSEWYKKYYGHAMAANTTASGLGAHAAAGGDHASLNSSSLAAATADGRESVHSGRSSVQNDKDRSGHVSLRDVDAIAEPDPQRLTPRKFVNEHAIATLSAGILVTVKPKYTSHGAISNIVKLQRLGANDATRQLFQAYPGPLVRGLTHKKTIIEFCEEQIRLGPMETTIYAKQLLCNNIEKYRGSYTLMWNLLILLLRQNGMVVGTDIAELLLKNQQQFPYQAENTDDNSSALSGDEEESGEAAALETESPTAHENTEHASAAHVDGAPKSTTTPTTPPALSEAEITEKFRNYLLYGNVNEALDWATDNNLWGHALFLASKVDRRSHANVMMKFANKLELNDPLQTLYQLMSGRQPSSVTSVQDEKWGDWRPHLSMILSNTSQKPELDRKSITTLGDSLLNRGDLFAAHFCYLMAQVGFGRYQESATQESTLQQHLPKLVLLGSSHYKTFNDFATSEAIIMTEIYEYACSLNDDKFSVVEFQPYKYLLATRLLDYGYHLRSLMYFEQIALHIQRDPSKYEPSFINKIYQFADRLKHYDPVLERSIDDQQQNAEENLNNSQLPSFEEQAWLKDLRAIAVQHKIEYPSPAAPGYGQSTETQSLIDQQFAEINKQFNELNMQYNSISNAEQPPAFYNPDTQQQQPQPQPLHDLKADPYNQQPQLAVATADYNNLQGSADQQAPATYTDADAQKSVDASDAYAYYNQHQQQPYQGYGAESMAAQNNAGAYDYWAQQQQQQQQQQQHVGYGDEYSTNDDNELVLAATDPAETPSPEDSTKSVEQNLKSNDILTLNQAPAKARSTAKTYTTTLESGSKLQQQQPLKITAAAAKLYNSYDGPQTRVAKKLNTNYKNNKEQQKQQHSAKLATSFLSSPPDNARPTISMPKSKNYGSDNDKQQKGSANAGNRKGEQQRGKIDGGKEANKSSQQGNQNSGWFGGIWNKLSLKPKNQMILPDDKNPSIVWDPEKKRWVNTDGDAAAEESFKPPPKMSDIVAHAPPAAVPTVAQPYQQQQQLQQQQPQPMQAQQPSPLLDTHQYAAVSAPTPAAAPAPSASPAPVSGYSAHALTGADTAGASKTPSLQSNMFKMQRNRTLKNSYVDVFNPSGAPMKATENVLAPALPPAVIPQSGFFIPGPGPVAATGDNNDAGAYQQQQQQQQMPQQDVPQFYNPNQFGGGAY